MTVSQFLKPLLLVALYYGFFLLTTELFYNRMQDDTQALTKSLIAAEMPREQVIAIEHVMNSVRHNVDSFLSLNWFFLGSLLFCSSLPFKNNNDK